MSKFGVRIKKSRSMMLSLYSLSGFASVLVFAFIATLWGRSLGSLFDFRWHMINEVLQRSLLVQSVALCLAIPLAASLTYFSVFLRNTRKAPVYESCLRFVENLPVLILGVIFLVLLGGEYWSFVLTFILMAAAELNRRWKQVAFKVKVIEIESLQSMGAGVLQIVQVLYLKRYLKLFLAHLLAVFCKIFVVVTPVLCFVGFSSEQNHLLPTYLFVSVLAEAPYLSGLALIILLVHGLRVYIDQKTSFWEVDFG